MAALAVAAPNHLPAAPVPAGYGSQAPEDVHEIVETLKDERSQDSDGTYSLAVEAENGIVLSMSGSPAGPEGAVVASGQYS